MVWGYVKSPENTASTCQWFKKGEDILPKDIDEQLASRLGTTIEDENFFWGAIEMELPNDKNQ